MEITIITPVYEGNQYLPMYLQSVKQAVTRCERMNQDWHIEIMFVNDSPWMELMYPKELAEGLTIRCITNEKNMGIHASRARAVTEAKGDYLLFLDQDDALTEDGIHRLIAHTKGADVVVGNGLFEKKNHAEKIYGNVPSQWFATRGFAFRWIRDFITSPGQCLIKKSAIPSYWLQHPLKHNGTDDYFLFLLMMEQGCQFAVCPDIVYVHKYTGENFSLNEDKMFLSTREMLHLLNKNPEFSKKHLQLMKRRIAYKRIDRRRKSIFFKESLKNVDILFVNFMYRLLWRGCLIKKEEV